MTPEQFAADYIRRWEGGGAKGYYSIDGNDNGNWTGGRIGAGALVGSNYGVTAATLATYRSQTANTITVADIKAITLAGAVQIALALFYVRPGLDRLEWNRATASILDFGWGAGPGTGIRQLQGLLDCTPDGIIGIGGQTAKAFAARARRSEEALAGAWWATREAYYEALVARRPSDAIYLRGWDNRSDYFMPGHPEGWWGKW